MTHVTNVADLHPDRIPGYHDGPFARRPELLNQKLFWHGHLYSCAQGNAGRLLWGADYAWADHRNFQRRLWERGDWPAFTIPLAAGHRLHVVYRTIEDEAGVDYLLHHPDWEQADLIARDDGHFMGPGLSWMELVAAADSAPPGGTAPDAHAHLLLLLPALGDNTVPEQAVYRLAAALSDCLGSRRRSRWPPPSWKARGRRVLRIGPLPMAASGSTTADIPSVTRPTTSPWQTTAWRVCLPR